MKYHMRPMNILQTSVLFLLMLSGCKDDSVTDVEDYRGLYEAAQVLEKMDERVLEYNGQGKIAPEALMLAMADIKQDATVDTAWHLDSAYVYIQMKSGMETVYFIVAVDEDGNYLTRGGGNDFNNNLTIKSWKTTTEECTNEMENKDILLFNSQFQSSQIAKNIIINNKDRLGLGYKELIGPQCNIDALNTFGDYGLVIINTHGFPNGFQMGDKVPEAIKKPSPTLDAFAESINTEQDRRINDLLKENLFSLTKKRPYYAGGVPINLVTSNDADLVAYFVNGKYISQMQGLNGTIVFGNMCYSGYTSTQHVSLSDIPIATAFQQAGVLAYYGYQTSFGASFEVNTKSAEKFEEILLYSFLVDNDSTGIAHLKADGTEYIDTLANVSRVRRLGELYFKQFGNDTYCFGGCGEVLVDTRDGQEYQTVCIGNQVWMAENLRYSTGSLGLCYGNDPANCDKYGRLYFWDEIVNNVTDTSSTVPSGIKGICPAGWHLPSLDEWAELIIGIGGSEGAGQKLKATTDWSSSSPGTDEYGFNALPAGSSTNRANPPVTFFDLGIATDFWTVTPYAPSVNGFDVHTIRISSNDDDIYPTSSRPAIPALDGGAVSCRCIKD